MGSDVNLEPTRARVPLATDIALIWLFSRVNQTVSFEVTFGNKSLAALREITDERPFPCLTIYITDAVVLRVFSSAFSNYQFPGTVSGNS